MTKTVLRHLFLWALLLLGGASAQAAYQPRELEIPPGIDAEAAKDAGNRALDELVREFLATNPAPRRYAVLPLQVDADSGYFAMTLRSHLATQGASKGLELYTREDDDWNSLLHEIKWGQQFGDTMDPSTIQKFGRIQGVQAIVTGRIVSVNRGIGEVRVRASLQVFEVETGRLIWAGEQVGKVTGPLGGPSQWAGAVGIFAAICVAFWIVKQIARAARPR